MVDAVQVPTSGFSVPSVPGAPSAPVPPSQPVSPPANPQDAWKSQVPAPVATPGGIDAAQYAAFLAYQKANAGPANPALAPNAGITAPTAPVVPAVNPNASLTAFDSNLNDPVLRSLTQIFVGTAKDIDLSRSISNALVTGDPRLIDRAYIREKGGDNADHLVALAEGIVSRVQQATQESVQVAHSTAGGEAQWNAATAAFNTSAPAHLRTVVSTLMNSGDPESIKAATQTVVEFAQKSGVVPQPGTRIQTSGAGPTGQALDKLSFQKAHAALDANSRTYSQDRAALYERRQLGKLQGL